MSPDEASVSTVTFRIPNSLKETLESVSAATGETATALMRTALEQFFGSKDRVYELAGYRPEFSAFLKRMQKEGPVPVALLAIGRDHRGYVYEGSLDFELTSESVVALKATQGQILIPRAFIVGWHGDSKTANRFAMAAMRGGWTNATPNSYL